MILIVEQPDVFSLAGNPMYYKVLTRNLMSEEGQLATLDFLFAGSNIDDISIGFGTKTVTFSTQGTAGSYPYVQGQFVEAITDNVELYEFYEITKVSENRVKLVAKGFGNTYNILPNYGNNEVQVFSSLSNVDRVYRDNFRIVANTYTKDENEKLSLLHSDKLDVDGEGYADIDISELLYKYTSRQFNHPDDSFDAISKFPINIRYKVVFTEYCDISTKLDENEGAYKYALSGALSIAQYMKFKELETNFYEDFTYRKRFLTWVPAEKTIGAQQPEYLYWLNMSYDCTQIKVNCRKYYADDTYDTTYNIFTTATKLGELVCISASPYFYFMEGIGKQVNKYEIWLTDQDDEVMSETRVFIIDRKPHTTERYIIFRNSFGVYDSLRTYGVSANQNEFDRSYNVMAMAHDSDGRLIASNKNTRQDKLNVNTGFISKSMVEYLTELFISPEMYLLNEMMTIPFNIANKTQDYSREDECLFFYTLELELSHKDPAFSNLNYQGSEQGDYNDDFNYDYNVR